MLVFLNQSLFTYSFCSKLLLSLQDVQQPQQQVQPQPAQPQPKPAQAQPPQPQKESFNQDETTATTTTTTSSANSIFNPFLSPPLQRSEKAEEKENGTNNDAELTLQHCTKNDIIPLNLTKPRKNFEVSKVNLMFNLISRFCF